MSQDTLSSQPTHFWPRWGLFLFFSFFFFLLFVRSSSPKPQNTEIQFLCKVVELQTQFFLPKFFGATPPGTPPKWGSKKSIFWTAQARVLVVFDISRYSTDKYFDIVWGCHPLGVPPPRGATPSGPPQMDPPKINVSNSSTWVPVCFDISRYLTNKYFDIVWWCHPPGDPPNEPPKNQFLNSSS